MISISSYHGDCASTENNAKVIRIGENEFYFSFETLVAIRRGTELKVIQNCWGPTTGRHLNAIDGGSPEAKEARLSREDFERLVGQINITVE